VLLITKFVFLEVMLFTQKIVLVVILECTDGLCRSKWFMYIYVYMAQYLDLCI